jgi:hypothetical protein
MSALGQKQTFAVQKTSCPLYPPIATAKADMCGATGDVRFGPIADIPLTKTECVTERRCGFTAAEDKGVLRPP